MAANPKPFYEAIVDEANTVNSGARAGWTNSQLWAALSVLTAVTEQSLLPQNHDAIQEAFEIAYAELGMNAPGSLLAHIAAEKERCALEIARHLQERDGKKEGKRRSSFDAATILDK